MPFCSALDTATVLKEKRRKKHLPRLDFHRFTLIMNWTCIKVEFTLVIDRERMDNPNEQKNHHHHQLGNCISIFLVLFSYLKGEECALIRSSKVTLLNLGSMICIKMWIHPKITFYALAHDSVWMLSSLVERMISREKYRWRGWRVVENKNRTTRKTK